MPTATLNGITICYEDAGNGPALLLTHGFAASRLMWRPQLEDLAADYRVVAWDMRGHAGTDSPDQPEDYSEEATLADMRALLCHLGIARAVVGGLSLGGYMSLAFYGRYPEMVRGLVLCDTGPGYRNPEARAEWNAMAERYAVGLENRGLASLAESPEVAQAAAMHRSAAGLAHAARGMLKQFDSRIIEMLPSIRVPTLVIVGERDRPFLTASDYMAAKIPGAKKVVLAGAGHASNLDRPVEFNRALREFLQGLGE